MPVVMASGLQPISKTVILWDNKANINNISGSSTATGFPAVNAVDDATWSSWRGTSFPSAIRVDLGSPQTVDSFGIAAHNIFSSGVSEFQIQASSDNLTFTDAIRVTPTTDQDYMCLFNPMTYRYWRLHLSGAVANIGYLFIGNRLVMPSAPLDDYTPINYARQYTKLSNESIGGQWLNNRVISSTAETSAEWSPLSRLWVDANITGFKNHYDQGGTFFYASSPSRYPLDMGYCKAAGETDTVDVSYIEGDKLASVGFSMRAYVAQ